MTSFLGSLSSLLILSSIVVATTAHGNKNNVGATSQQQRKLRTSSSSSSSLSSSNNNQNEQSQRQLLHRHLQTTTTTVSTSTFGPQQYFPDVYLGTMACYRYYEGYEPSTGEPSVPTKFLTQTGLFQPTIEECCHTYLYPIWQNCVVNSGGTLSPTYNWYHDGTTCVKDCPAWEEMKCGGTLHGYVKSKADRLAELQADLNGEVYVATMDVTLYDSITACCTHNTCTSPQEPSHTHVWGDDGHVHPDPTPNPTPNPTKWQSDGHPTHAHTHPPTKWGDDGHDGYPNANSDGHTHGPDGLWPGGVDGHVHDVGSGFGTGGSGGTGGTGGSGGGSGGIPTMGTGGFWADYTNAQRCVQNCPVGSALSCGGSPVGMTEHATAAQCCSMDYNWYQQDLCVVLAETGGTGYTGMWYADLGNGVCYQDCDPATGGGSCRGNPGELDCPLYGDVTTCCGTTWRGTDACVGMSQVSPTTTTSGGGGTTGGGVAGGTTRSMDPTGWWADYNGSQRCVRNCPVGSGLSCGGYAPSGGIDIFPTAEQCCTHRYSWYQQDICVVLAQSGGTGHTGMWYADLTNGVCYQDCDADQGGSCRGNPGELDCPLFDTISACCASTWNTKCVSQTERLGSSVSPTGSGLWYYNWLGFSSGCSKDCPVTNGDGCGGLLEELESYTTDGTTFATETECCAHHFPWMDARLCAAHSDGTQYTYQYYADQTNGVCYQDCPFEEGGDCNGPVPTIHLNEQMYSNLADCCDEKIWWRGTANCAVPPPVTDPEPQRCGGSNNACSSPDEFCFKTLESSGSGLCSSGAMGICLPKPTMCTQQYDPVCGCDGNTHGNECSAYLNGVSVMHGGECMDTDTMSWGDDGHVGHHTPDTTTTTWMSDGYTPDPTPNPTKKPTWMADGYTTPDPTKKPTWHNDGHTPCDVTLEDIATLEQQLEDAKTALEAAKHKLVKTLEDCVAIENDLAQVKEESTSKDDEITALEEGMDESILQKLKSIVQLELAIEGTKNKITNLVTQQEKMVQDMAAHQAAMDAAAQRSDQLLVAAQELASTVAFTEDEIIVDMEVAVANYTTSQMMLESETEGTEAIQ